MSGHNPREIAAFVLCDSIGAADFVETRLETALAGENLSARDRALAQELVYGVVRWKATLDWLVAHKTSGRTQSARLQVLLRLGLYQLFWLDRVPDYASVNETIKFARHNGLSHKAGFINALLRNYGREREETFRLLADLKINQPWLGYSHPQWLWDRWQTRWGVERTTRLLEWNNTPAVTYARINTLRTNCTDLRATWQSEGVQFIDRAWDWCGDNAVFELIKHPALVNLSSFQQGFFYIQDPSTLLSVKELNPLPGETVLDYCAAPGGKTTFISQLMQNQGKLFAWDEQPERYRRLQANCSRLGVTCMQASPPPQNGLPQFDKILVDVPCSNTGVMRRRLELRWRLKPTDLLELPGTQLAILKRAAVQLKAGGTLVYSTCSLEMEENQKVVAEFGAELPDFRLEFERQLLPFHEGVDGAYIARFSRLP